MLVYVLNQNSQPLMPCSPCKARKLLKQGKAIVFKTEPFTIQLLYGASRYKQIITLGIDAGSKVVGLSATTETKELYSGGNLITKRYREFIVYSKTESSNEKSQIAIQKTKIFKSCKEQKQRVVSTFY